MSPPKAGATKVCQGKPITSGHVPAHSKMCIYATKVVEYPVIKILLCYSQKVQACKAKVAGCTLLDLCPEDKAKVAKLIHQVILSLLSLDC